LRSDWTKLRCGYSITARANVAVMREPALIDPRRLLATLDSPPARRRYAN
jgi:hypothetical protein